MVRLAQARRLPQRGVDVQGECGDVSGRRADPLPPGGARQQGGLGVLHSGRVLVPGVQGVRVAGQLRGVEDDDVDSRGVRDTAGQLLGDVGDGLDVHLHLGLLGEGLHRFSQLLRGGLAGVGDDERHLARLGALLVVRGAGGECGRNGQSQGGQAERPASQHHVFSLWESRSAREQGVPWSLAPHRIAQRSTSGGDGGRARWGSASPGRRLGHIGGSPRPSYRRSRRPHPSPGRTSQEVAHGQHDDAGGQHIHQEPGCQPHSGGNAGEPGQGAVVLLRLT